MFRKPIWALLVGLIIATVQLYQLSALRGRSIIIGAIFNSAVMIALILFTLVLKPFLFACNSLDTYPCINILAQEKQH